MHNKVEYRSAAYYCLLNPFCYLINIYSYLLYFAKANGMHLAAAANWFLTFGAAGSAERALAASRSLLDAIETLFRLSTI